MKTSEVLAQISITCGFDKDRLEDKSKQLKEIMNRKELCNLPILIGFDINGPLVPTEDATLTPYSGTPEILQFLLKIPQVKLCLITGWDLSTVCQFVNKKLGFQNIGIISEKGMLFRNDETTYHLYPHLETEIDTFASAVFKVASEYRLQIAIQPNVSSGCQCVYFEAFNRSRLAMHPCVSGIEVNNLSLIDVLEENHIKYTIINESLKICAAIPFLYKLLKEKLPLFPLRILDVANNHVFIRVDSVDNPEYNWRNLIDTAAKISNLTDRLFDLNKDFSVDFSTRRANEGGYSKSSAAHKLGYMLFGDHFAIFNVGDKPGDAVDGDNAVFFPQDGTDAMGANINLGFSVADGREYALILAFYLLQFYRDGGE